MVLHIYNLSTQEAKAEESQVQGQFGLYSKTMSQKIYRDKNKHNKKKNKIYTPKTIKIEIEKLLLKFSRRANKAKNRVRAQWCEGISLYGKAAVIKTMWH
jgi:hypothetical protein